MLQFFLQKITVTGEELKGLVTNVTIAIQWYHRLLHMYRKTLLAPYPRKHISPLYKASIAHKLHLKGLRELKQCVGLELCICVGLDRGF